MRILVISNLYPPDVVGGFELQCSYAVDGLRRAGHRVAVLTSVPKVPVAGDPHLDPHVLRLLHQADVYHEARQHLRSPYWEIESNLVNSDNIALLLEVLTDFQPEVCYLWNLVALGGVALVATLEYLGVPWVWHLGDSVPAALSHFNGRLLPLAAEMGRRLTGTFIASSDTVLSATESAVDLGGRIALMPNWVSNVPPEAPRKHFDGSVLRIVHAGRLTEEKGTFILLEAVAALRDAGYSNFSVDLYGHGDLSRVASIMEDRDLHDLVHLNGWIAREDLLQRLLEYDVFVFPTHPDDPFPVAPLDAALQGCVPVVSSVQGFSEWFVHGVHCLKAERNPASFTDVLVQVLEGRWDLGEIGRRAASLVRSEFTWDVVRPRIEEQLALQAVRPQPACRGDLQSAHRMALIAEALLRQSVVELAGGAAER